jgi:antitoxin component HigA of HigAB toxin-antitoxin module
MKNKLLTLFFVILLIILGVYLSGVWKLVLGDSVVVSLDVDKKFLDLKHGEKDTFGFESKVITNPFCKANCDYVFLDVSANKIIEHGTFNINPGFSEKKEYSITAPLKGTGQELYRFGIECRGIDAFLCESNDVSTRYNLVAVNYSFSDEEIELKENSKDTINLLIDQLRVTKGKIKVLEEFNKSFEENFEKDLKDFEVLWKNEEYFALSSEVEETIDGFLDFENEVEESLKKTIKEIEEHNLEVNQLKKIKTNFDVLMNKSLNNSFVLEINDLINKFNSKENIDEVLIKSNELISREIINEDINISFLEIKEFDLENKTIGEVIPVNVSINLVDKDSKCCVFNECNDCSGNDKYPIILLHGHAINEDLSAEYSLEGFNQLQKRFEDDGYLNSGIVSVSTSNDFPYGSFGLINSSLTFRATYYYDIYGDNAIQSKSEDIDTYALRLKNLIDIVKYKTGKEKVNVVAFSMGGLVARKYAQIFEGASINKMILLGTPNKGIKGEISLLCPVFGSSLECRDMNENSLFMNGLNTGKTSVDLHNIYAKGCNMVDGEGDGAVLSSNAELSEARNYIIEGKCRSVAQPLHLDLLNFNLYPEVYDTLKIILEE